MWVKCPLCGHQLEYAQIAPRFCSNCGESLSTLIAQQTPTVPAGPSTYDPDATRRQLHFANYSSLHSTPSIPDQIGPYRLLRPLGGGGMGTVYEAEEFTGRRVALKLIRPEFADAPEAVERFRREGRLASTILHPRCVFVLAADDADGRPYIVMELMPGRNLADLVDASGPLPIDEAIRKILDVIEGLQEAHRIGVIHRDVKPSNCFLDAEGRIKVGDFGLAKSLIGPDQLTRSGAFLGTILYAAPEQIRHEVVDQRSDIYSVCATLYYLLTGQAPYFDSDPAAALARAVSDPIPSIRSLRREIPRTLEEVIRRGLARSPKQRWQTLEDLRLALLPFVEPAHALGEIGWRSTAYLFDLLLLTPLELALLTLVQTLIPTSLVTRIDPRFLPLLVSMFCGILYFAIPEAKWGFSPGKYLFRLRVRNARTRDYPALWRTVFRTYWFYLFKDSTALITWILLLLLGVHLFDETHTTISIRDVIGVVFMISLLPFLSGGVGLGLLSLTMRRRNGYRGIHELLSGTQVIRLPSSPSRVLVPAALSAWPEPDALPEQVPAEVGEYQVRGVARLETNEQVLFATDPTLDRHVWLWIRQAGQAPLSDRRFTLGRGTRPRWLSGCEKDGRRWDAFVAESGCLLADLVARKRLGWKDTLTCLEQLTNELIDARQENTLPDRLSLEQIWVQSSGRVILLDMPIRAGTPIRSEVELLKQTAHLALKRCPCPEKRLNKPIHAPLSGHALALLDRLMTCDSNPENLNEFRKELSRAHEMPEEINRPWRGMQVASASVVLLPGLALMFLLGPLLALVTYLICVVGLAVGDLAQKRCEEEIACVQVEPGKPKPVLLKDLEERLQQIIQNREALARDRQIVLNSWSWFMIRGLAPFQQRFRDQFIERLEVALNEENNDPEWLDTLITQEDNPMEGPSAFAAELLRIWWMLLLLFLLVPVLWAIGSALLRGGLTPWLFGIKLVGPNGRPAARWRCAWRTLVVWLPVSVLLYLSMVFELNRIGQARTSAQPEEMMMLAWLPWICWWTALGLLPIYALLALAWPDRGPQDRLAGTYLVPR